MTRRLSFKPAWLILACLAGRAEAASLEMIEANGNTLEDRSEANVINPLLTWVNSKPVVLLVHLDASDTASTIVFCGFIDGFPGRLRGKWRGFRIELGEGVTWAHNPDTVYDPWGINYVLPAPHIFVRGFVSLKADARSAMLGFRVPISTTPLTLLVARHKSLDSRTLRQANVSSKISALFQQVAFRQTLTSILPGELTE